MIIIENFKNTYKQRFSVFQYQELILEIEIVLIYFIGHFPETTIFIFNWKQCVQVIVVLYIS